ncbi:MAG: flagellar biosynthetic protein FliO [Planctomycetaceae bacterium]
MICADLFRWHSPFAMAALTFASLHGDLRGDDRTSRQSIERTSNSQSSNALFNHDGVDFDAIDDAPLGREETFDPRGLDEFPAEHGRAASSSRQPLPLKRPSETFAFKRSRADASRSKPAGSAESSDEADKKSRTSIPWGTTLFSLSLITGLILLCAWVMKKIQPLKVQGLSTDVVEVLGKRPLDQRQHIYLIRCGSRILLVGSSVNGMSTLTEIDDPAERDALIGLCRKPTEDSRLVQSFQTLLTKSNWWQTSRTGGAPAVNRSLTRPVDAPLNSGS